MVWTLNVLLSALVDSSLSMLMKNILNFALFCIFESSIIMNFQSFDSVQCTYNISIFITKVRLFCVNNNSLYILSSKFGLFVGNHTKLRSWH